MRVKVTLACTECKQRNYNTMKNKKNDPDRLEMSKFCRFCRKHTPHREGKQKGRDKSVADKEKKTNIFKRIGRSIKNMRGEMKRVVWPSRKQVVNNTFVVLCFMGIAALIVGLFDAGMGTLIRWVFGTP